MPPHKGPDLLEDRNVPKYDYVSFMERMSLGDGGKGEGGRGESGRGEGVGSPVRKNGSSNGV